MAEMNVISQTTVQQLCDIASQEGNDKIRGRDNGDGTFALYMSAKGSKTSFKEYFGLLDGRRQAARDAVNMVLQRVDDRTTILDRSSVGFDALRDNL